MVKQGTGMIVFKDGKELPFTGSLFKNDNFLIVCEKGEYTITNVGFNNFKLNI